MPSSFFTCLALFLEILLFYARLLVPFSCFISKTVAAFGLLASIKALSLATLPYFSLHLRDSTNVTETSICGASLHSCTHF
jgi:hypothetical protein